MKRYCRRVVNEENGSMLQLGDWMLMFALCLFLIKNLLRVSHLPHSLIQNIVQLANLLILRMSFKRLVTEFIREPNDDIPLKFYYHGFSWGLKKSQERKDWKETQQGVTEKQRNTTHHRGACINREWLRGDRDPVSRTNFNKIHATPFWISHCQRNLRETKFSRPNTNNSRITHTSWNKSRITCVQVFTNHVSF